MVSSAAMSAAKKAWLFLFVGIVAASQSGNIVRLSDASPFAISAWRLAIASLLLAPLAGSSLKRVARLERLDAVLLVLAGLALALHFFAWIAAVQHTTVANAAIFFAINPVLTSVGGWLFFRERPSARLAVSILLGLVAVIFIGVTDFDADPSRFYGNALAVLASVLFTTYFLLGKRVRRSVDSAAYVTCVYAVGALVAFIALGFAGSPIVDYSARNWVCFLLMALIPTMIGHTSINHAVAHIHAGRISAALLMEPLTAGIGAAIFWGEGVGAHTVAGYVLICVSVLILVLDPAAGVGRARGKDKP